MFYSGYFCDKCGDAIEYKRATNAWLPSKTHLVAFAREEGWSVGKRVLCPKCRNMKNKNGTVLR